MSCLRARSARCVSPGAPMLLVHQHEGDVHRHEGIHPLVYQALIAATEYVSSWLFSKRRRSETDIATAREVMLRAVLWTLADGPK